MIIRGMAPPRHDSRVEKWQRWLDDRIEHEILSLHFNRYVFRALGEITQRRDPQLPPSAFFDFVGDAYATTQSIAVRRQVEQGPRVVSLGTLLTEIRDDPQRLTRERFVGLFPPEDVRRAEAGFASFSGDVGDHIDPAVVDADLARLDAEGRAVIRYVDRHLAHADRGRLTRLPLFADLNAAIDAVGDVFTKYWLLLFAETYWTLVPAPQYDWVAPFRQPWILGPENEPTDPPP